MHIVSNPLVEARFEAGPARVIMADGILLGEMPANMAPPPAESVERPAPIPAAKPRTWGNRYARKGATSEGAGDFETEV